LVGVLWFVQIEIIEGEGREAWLVAGGWFCLAGRRFLLLTQVRDLVFAEAQVGE
jgi:hypothetical protein